MNTHIKRWMRGGVAAGLVGLTVLIPARSTVATYAQSVLLDTPVVGTTFPGAAPSLANVSVFATGLNNPRELKFGPDGNLYVAEGGVGGTNSTVGQCQQVPAPIGPYGGSSTSGRISKISPDGKRTTITDTLPSSQTQPIPGPLVSGVADIGFVGDTLYALEAGAGCSHGVPNVPNGLFRVNPDGTTSLVADLGAFLKANPVAHPSPDDFEPDGTWYSMVRVGSDFYAVEPNHGELDRINALTGQVSRAADISASQGHIVPTVVAYHNGDFYVANLNTFPIVPGSSKILRITPDGVVSVAVTGLTAVLGLDFDAQGNMYALEMSTVPGDPTPGTGMVVRIDGSEHITPVASGLVFPTGLTLAPGGQLYVSERGFGFPPGAGRIVRIPVAQLSTSASGTSASISIPFQSATPGQSYVLFGPGPGCSGLVELATRDLGAGTTSHTVVVTGDDMHLGTSGLLPGETYFYEIVTLSSSGAVSIDDNAGSCYSFTVPGP